MKQQRVTASQPPFNRCERVFVQVAALRSADRATNVIGGKMKMLLKASPLLLWR